MRRIFTSALCVTGLSLALLATTPGFAQVTDQTRSHVADQLGRMNIRVTGGVGSLEDQQISQIEGILRGSGSQSEKRAQIARIAMEDAPCYASPQLRADTASELRRIGMDAGGVDDYTGDEIVQMQLVLHSNISDGEKRSRIQRMMGDGAPQLEQAQLRQEVEHCLRDMNIDTTDLQALSPSEIAEINLILSSGDTDSGKRQQIGQIME